MIIQVIYTKQMVMKYSEVADGCRIIYLLNYPWQKYVNSDLLCIFLSPSLKIQLEQAEEILLNENVGYMCL